MSDTTAPDTTAPEVTLHLADLLADPLRVLDEARRGGPVAQGEYGHLTLTHELAMAMLRSGSCEPNFIEAIETFGVTSGPFHDWMSYSPLNTEGEPHRRWRALMSRTFTPRRVDVLRPFLGATAHELIDGFTLGEPIDFVQAFSHHFPLLALCELIGVPTEDRRDFAEWADMIGLGFNPIELPMHLADVDAAVTALTAFTARLVAARRVDPRDDLVSRIAIQGHDEGYDDEQLAGFVAGLVFAGHETTKMQLGWMISVLADHPDVWDRVGADPTLAPAVVDEVMRVRSAATGVGRRVTEDADIGGCPFRAGDRVLVSLWAANHDPAAYGDDAFDPGAAAEREPHLAFGYGAHYCLGAGLAKAELQEALVALAGRLTGPVLADGAAWRPPLGINGPILLPVTFTTR